jgi:predicted AAA+ superfamily ATPase
MSTTSHYSRLIEPRLAEALLDTPVVLLAGPRQAGKTTLVKQIAQQQGLRYLTMDDELTLLSAREDPVGMIRGLDRAVIDEVQRAPQLLLAIKKSVDEVRRPGRFLLTGSANLMALPTVADSLAGRMETLSLLPLSQSELESRTANWIDSDFAGQILKADQPAVGGDLVELVLRGGYPHRRAVFVLLLFLFSCPFSDLSKPLRAHYFDMGKGLILEIQEGLKMNSLNMFKI